MRLELILGDGLGKKILLPPEFALDDYDLGKDVPGVVLPGKDGRLVYEHLQRLEPVTLRASGSLFCGNAENADQTAGELRSLLMGQKEPIWLKRYEGADRFIRVRCTRINHNPHRGRYRAGLFTFNIGLQADDPFWYSSDYVSDTVDVQFASSPLPTFVEIENEGGCVVNPVIRVEGQTSGGQSTKNFRFTNYSTGQVLSYSGEVKNNELITFDTAKKDAYFVGSLLLHSGTARSAGTFSIQLATTASAEDNIYNGHIVVITSGTGEGQARKIESYDGNTRTAVVGAIYGDEHNWETNPTSSSGYQIYHPAWAENYYLYEAQIGVLRQKENVAKNVNNGYLIEGFSLVPGVNRIEVEEPLGLLKFKYIFRKGWL